MLSKFLISLALLAFIVVAGSFVVLAVWDVPVAKKEVGKPLEVSSFLEKK